MHEKLARWHPPISGLDVFKSFIKPSLGSCCYFKTPKSPERDHHQITTSPKHPLCGNAAAHFGLPSRKSVECSFHLNAVKLSSPFLPEREAFGIGSERSTALCGTTNLSACQKPRKPCKTKANTSLFIPLPTSSGFEESQKIHVTLGCRSHFLFC